MPINTATNTQLLAMLLDPAAEEIWCEFDKRYRSILIAFARRLGLNPEDAADVAQETLTRFAQGYRQGKYDRGRGRLRSWMLGIARHLIADQLTARASRRNWRGHSVLEALPAEPQLTAMWDEERRTTIIARAMEELRRSTRTSEQSIRAFEMVVFHRRAPEDVAQELGMTRHDVYVAKHRVTERLRRIAAALEKLYDAEA